MALISRALSRSRLSGFVHRWRAWLLISVSVISLGFAACVFAFVAPGISRVVKERVNRLPFDSGQWKSSLHDSRADPIRLRMVDDLLRRHRLVGLARQEVIALLGVAPPTEHFRGYDQVCYLGPERGFMSIDSEWLVLRFDSENRVTEARIVRD